MKNWKWCMLPLIAAGLLGWPGVSFGGAMKTKGLDISGNATYTVSEDVDAENSSYPSYIYGVYSNHSTALEKLDIEDVSITATGGNGTDDQTIEEVSGVYINSASDLILENQGSISARAVAGDSTNSWLEVYDISGMNIVGSVEKFSNTGTITADVSVGNNNATDISNYAAAYNIAGVFFENSINTFYNRGEIATNIEIGNGYGGSDTYSDVYIDDSYGAYFSSSVDTFENTGSITIQTIMGNSEGYYTYAGTYDIYGAYFEDTVTNFMNSGTISADSTVGDVNGYDDSKAYAYDIYGIDFDGDVAAFSNSGTISADATVGDANGDDSGAYAAGIFGALLEGDVATFDNSGTISAAAEAGSATGSNSTVSVTEVVGVRGSFDTLENSGTISAAATAGDASGENASVTIEGVCGILASDGDSESLTNSGTILVEVSAGSNAAVNGVAGIVNGNSVNSTITNSGTVLVEASAGSNAAVSNIFGIADVNSVNSTIINTGTISVDATEGDTVAAIYLQNAENALISSSGHIYTTNGARALYLKESSATLSDSFSVSLSDPTSSSYTCPIYIDATSSLDLNDATLAVELAYGESIVFDTDYAIIENDGTVTGTFSSLDALEIELANPAITAQWSGSDNGENAAVSFAYDPQASSAALSLEAGRLAAVQGITMIQNRMVSQVLASNMSQETPLLADAGTIASDAGFSTAHPQKNSPNALFLRPYVTTLDRPSDGGIGYDGTTTGLVLGYDWNFNPDFTLGLHGGIAQSDIDYTGTGYDENSEDQDMYSLGAHASYTYNAWHADMSTTLYTARHEYDGLTGANLELDEDDDYTSYGAETQILGGYLFNFGNLAILPEAGIGHSWANSGSHTTDADDSDWDTQYDSYDDHVLYSILGVHFMGTWELGGARVIPSLGLRWEQALTDNDIAVSQSLPGTGSIKVTDNVSDASYIGDASLTFARDAVSMELGFTSQYNDDFRANGAWISFKWGF